jgi:hypothetical protein
MNSLLSTTYFGPVQWYQKLYRSDSVIVDGDEVFQKQTFRNRCYIAAANGVQALTVPVEKARLTRDVRISDHGDWRRVHWNAIQSAYGESPFFEYYQDDLRPFYEQRWDYLLDFNEAIREVVCQLIDIAPRIETLPSVPTASWTDYRSGINPKHPDPDETFICKAYYQVYASRYGFQKNLSVLDLLLNMGPESIFYL